MALLYFMYGFKKMILTSIVLIWFLMVLAAFMKLTDYALSLSGIAVIILSIGMWVDANILMYERLREELKEGKSMVWAIDHAKDRSRTAIRDGQISTGLIAFVLFSMGTNVFKWFGSMLMVTMLLTLFFNVPLTKLLLHAFYDPKKKV
jgi:preprotein translocase subunit SecD